jgi:hypothetical protein
MFYLSLLVKFRNLVILYTIYQYHISKYSKCSIFHILAQYYGNKKWRVILPLCKQVDKSKAEPARAYLTNVIWDNKSMMFILSTRKNFWENIYYPLYEASMKKGK